MRVSNRSGRQEDRADPNRRGEGVPRGIPAPLMLTRVEQRSNQNSPFQRGSQRVPSGGNRPIVVIRADRWSNQGYGTAAHHMRHWSSTRD
jgi:hypothetical protein